jgi:methyl-accepting chemotaxis protein
MFGKDGSGSNLNVQNSWANEALTVVVQFEVLQLAARSREIAIYIQEIASDIEEIGIYIMEIAADSRKTGIYWSEIATYIQEMAVNIGEIRSYTRRTAARSRGMAANSPFPTIYA